MTTPCASCGVPTPVLVVIVGRGGESALCVRCYRTPPAAILPTRQVKKPAAPTSKQLTTAGVKR